METLKKIILTPFNLIFKLFLWSSGANLEILEQAPTDKNKYYGIGGTIVFTACMATFAGGYAFNTAFKDPTLSVFFGLFWGALIFNIDRYIVSTFGVGDGKRTISKQEIIEASPRILMAIILGIVIATPLELKIFEKEIKTRVERLKIEKKEELISADTSFHASLSEKKETISKIDSDITNLRENKKRYLENAVEFLSVRKSELENDSKQKKQELDVAQTNMNNRYSVYITAYRDTTGRYSSSEVRRMKRRYNEAKSIRNTISGEKNEIDDAISKIESDKESTLNNEAANIDKEIALLRTQKESLVTKVSEMGDTDSAKRDNYKNISDNYDGFAAHLEALGTLTEEKDSIWYAKWLITLMFIFIEIAPILFKMMTERGPYDDILDRIRHEKRVTQLLLQSNLNEEINTKVRAHSDKNAQLLRSELLANKEILDQIARAQAEIAQVAIDAWKDEQIKIVRENPSVMISSNGK